MCVDSRSSPIWASRRFSNLLLLLALLAGCSADLTPVTAVTGLRVLGVAVDPPEVGPGDTSSFRLLVADPLGEGRALDWFVALCTPSSDGMCLEYDEVVSRYGEGPVSECSDDTCTFACTQYCRDADCSPEDLQACCVNCEFASCCMRGGTATPVDGVLEVDGRDYPPLTYSSRALDGLTSREAQEGVNAQLTVLVCESGVCMDQETQGEGAQGMAGGFSPEALAYVLPPDQSFVAVKRTRISAAAPGDRNRNPTLEGLEVDGTLYRSGDRVVLPSSAIVTLTPVLAAGAIEAYTYTTTEGTVEDRCEAPYFSWYATAGDIDEAYTEPAPIPGCAWEGGELPDAANHWTLPDTPSPGTPLSLFVVVRDRRGGMDWVVLEVDME